MANSDIDDEIDIQTLCSIPDTCASATSPPLTSSSQAAPFLPSGSLASPARSPLSPSKPAPFDPSTSTQQDESSKMSGDHRGQVGAPMLPEQVKTYESLDKMISSSKGEDGLTNEVFVYEEKYDGERTICRVTRVEGTDEFVCEYFSRNLHSFGKRVPPISVHLRHPYVSAVIDGERVYVGKDGQVVPLGSTGNRSGNKYTQRYVVFDVQSVNGKSVTGLTFSARHQLLSELLVEAADVSIISQSPFTTISDLRLALDAVLAHGGEGIVLKKCSSLYHCGERPEDWLKLKPLQLDEHRIELDLFVRRAFRSKSGIYGLLECGYYNTSNPDEYNDKTFVRVCRIPGGLSEQDCSLVASMVDPKTFIVGNGRVVVVLSAEKPQAGCHSLRYPRFIRFAFEKEVVDVREVFK